MAEIKTGNEVEIKRLIRDIVMHYPSWKESDYKDRLIKNSGYIAERTDVFAAALKADLTERLTAHCGEAGDGDLEKKILSEVAKTVKEGNCSCLLSGLDAEWVKEVFVGKENSENIANEFCRILDLQKTVEEKVSRKPSARRTFVREPARATL